ncbi:hypothetical protein OEZ85_008959 [Tetradesmus obliquus]|uniref:Uncharacterized protein n=1 Tax=Tetradesmus obliquus TaxID=3088 RepID=A0ABY8TKB4_TETOB|nr:hypothetical protein OEZ85_008959 [Tetradesmus obliquus]
MPEPDQHHQQQQQQQHEAEELTLLLRQPLPQPERAYEPVLRCSVDLAGLPHQQQQQQQQAPGLAGVAALNSSVDLSGGLHQQQQQPEPAAVLPPWLAWHGEEEQWETLRMQWQRQQQLRQQQQPLLQEGAGQTPARHDSSSSSATWTTVSCSRTAQSAGDESRLVSPGMQPRKESSSVLLSGPYTSYTNELCARRSSNSSSGASDCITIVVDSTHSTLAGGEADRMQQQLSAAAAHCNAEDAVSDAQARGQVYQHVTTIVWPDSSAGAAASACDAAAAAGVAAAPREHTELEGVQAQPAAAGLATPVNAAGSTTSPDGSPAAAEAAGSSRRKTSSASNARHTNPSSTKPCLRANGSPSSSTSYRTAAQQQQQDSEHICDAVEAHSPRAAAAPPGTPAAAAAAAAAGCVSHGAKQPSPRVTFHDDTSLGILSIPSPSLAALQAHHNDDSTAEPGRLLHSCPAVPRNLLQCDAMWAGSASGYEAAAAAARDLALGRAGSSNGVVAAGAVADGLTGILVLVASFQIAELSTDEEECSVVEEEAEQ